MKQIALINIEGVNENEAMGYRTREACRAVVFDSEGKVALLHVTKENYYKLPGGGIEEGEDKVSSLKRECLEEIGCDIDITKELGFIVEYRKISNLKQTSFCYCANLKGEKGLPNFTEHEKENGFEQIWVSYEEALKFLSPINSSLDDEIKTKTYIVSRDYCILREVEIMVI